jgi:predicted nucleotidyltransferase
MRLQPLAREAIARTVAKVLGNDAQVRLFGSRLDDAARGGDVDLHISLVKAPLNPAWDSASLSVALQRQLDGRKVDVRLWWPDLPPQSIDRVAWHDGVLL